MSNISEHRLETRRERYVSKMPVAHSYPISLASVNFMEPENVAFLSRALACFGGKDIHVIGKVPDYKDLRRLSGSHSVYVNFIQHSNPTDFIKYIQDNDIFLISLELTDDSIDLSDYTFPKDREIVAVIGHEITGVPVEILYRSDAVIKIPMPGWGACLNASQSGNVLLYEYVRQMKG